MCELSKLTDHMSFYWQNEQFELSPSILAFLHHWNFGTSTAYYKDRSKSLLLPNKLGKLIRITNIKGALDSALSEYNSQSEKIMAKNELSNSLNSK